MLWSYTSCLSAMAGRELSDVVEMEIPVFRGPGTGVGVRGFCWCCLDCKDGFVS